MIFFSLNWYQGRRQGGQLPPLILEIYVVNHPLAPKAGAPPDWYTTDGPYYVYLPFSNSALWILLPGQRQDENLLVDRREARLPRTRLRGKAIVGSWNIVKYGRQRNQLTAAARQGPGHQLVRPRWGWGTGPNSRFRSPFTTSLFTYTCQHPGGVTNTFSVWIFFAK